MPKANPLAINAIKDLSKPQIQLANRTTGTGTRLLLDRELIKAGISGENITGYDHEFSKHLDVGLEILAGRAVAGMLDLDFIPLRWERFDLLVRKEVFFDPGVQRFISLLHDPAFYELATQLEGYDLTISSKMIFPKDTPKINQEPDK